MTLHKDRIRRETLANKISRSKGRKRAYRRDLRGRFSVAEAKRSIGSPATLAKRVTKKVRPTASGITTRALAVKKKRRAA